MVSFSRAVHLLPLLWPLLVLVTIFTPYIIALSFGHVYPFLPSISKTAAFEPEGSIFGFLMTFVAILGLLAILCRYLQLDGADGDCNTSALDKIKWFNKVALPLGFACILGVVIASNFRSSLVSEISLVGNMHNAGTALLFVSGVLYYWFQTIISYHSVKVGLTTEYTFFFRFAVSFFFTFIGVSYPFFRWYSYTEFSDSNSPTKLANWRPGDGGYILHAMNCAGEWAACVGLAIYALSFYKEFQTFSVEVLYVGNEGRPKSRGWRILADKWKQIRRDME